MLKKSKCNTILLVIFQHIYQYNEAPSLKTTKINYIYLKFLKSHTFLGTGIRIEPIVVNYCCNNKEPWASPS